MWVDIASIVFACVTVNHLGLIRAIEETFFVELRVVNCVKCFSFWAVLLYALFHCGLITALAVSFLASYVAIWLELAEGYLDILYNRIYEKIYPYYTDDTVAPDPGEGHPAGTVS